MVVPIYTPTNISLYILNISSWSVICVLNIFPNLLCPVFLVNRSSSIVFRYYYKDRNLSIFSFMVSILCVLFMKSLCIPNSSPMYSYKRFIALLFTVRSRALQAYQLFRISMDSWLFTVRNLTTLLCIFVCLIQESFCTTAVKFPSESLNSTWQKAGDSNVLIQDQK